MLKNALLWELSKDGVPKSYLFGTMHVRDDVAFTYLHEALKYLYRVDEFRSEINLDAAKDQLSVLDYCLKDNQNISDLVSAHKFNKMNSILLKSFDISLVQYDRFLPLIIINKVSESLLTKDRSEALDSYLWSEASKLKLNCDGLETLEEQLGTLTALDIITQLKMLKDLCRNVNSFKLSLIKTTELYRSQSIPLLFKMTKKSLGNFKNILLYQRNIRMANRIEEQLGKATFYAVGAAHLAGNQGVLPLLKRKGVILKPLS